MNIRLQVFKHEKGQYSHALTGMIAIPMNATRLCTGLRHQLTRLRASGTPRPLVRVVAIHTMGLFSMNQWRNRLSFRTLAGWVVHTAFMYRFGVFSTRTSSFH